MICVVATLIFTMTLWPLFAGDLNPPAGPVAPSPGPEPRIAVNATNTPGDADSVFRIIQSGSYYLTGNVTGAAAQHGIQIEAGDVTLDLNGFTLLGVAGSLDGINMPGFRENVVIRNGNTQFWGGSGVETRIDIGRIEHIVATDNGAWGIDNNPSGTFTTRGASCEVKSNGGLVAGTGGIRGGQSAVITDCVSFGNTGNGITAGHGSLVTGCTSRGSTADGISVALFSVVTGCTAISNTGDGIEAGGDCRVAGNLFSSNGAAGIHTTAVDNHFEGNTCTNNLRGIDVDAAGNIIVRNTCSGNGTNWDVAAGNVCLVVSATTAGVISGNSGGTAPGSTDPNANFSY
jgi:parallel beta-helix repeat protein